jgi:branched-chain amino acid aminotransferase
MRLGDLRRVDADLAAGVFGGEADHQRVGERPRLAADVAHVGDLDPHLLTDLAADRLLERLARLDEAGERAEEPRRQVVAAPEEHPVAPPHEDDHRRRDAREAGEATPRAAPCELARGLLAGGAAAAAETVGAAPFEDVEGAHGEPRLGGGEGAEQRPQLAQLRAVGQDRAGRQVGDSQRRRLGKAEREVDGWLAGRGDGEEGRLLERQQGRRGGPTPDDEAAPLEGEEPGEVGGHRQEHRTTAALRPQGGGNPVAAVRVAAMEPSKYIWHRGQLVPWQDATIHVLSHALHYGSAVFEGIRAYDTAAHGPVIFRLREHVRRLRESARIYRLELPHSQEELEAACREVVRANDLRSAYLRPIGYRGYGSLGVGAIDRCPVEVAVAAFRWGAYLGAEAMEKGANVMVSSWRRVAPDTLPAMAKAGGNYLSGQLMAAEAKRLGFDEALALDTLGYLSEGAGENVFLVRDGVLVTPAVSSAILPGITRDTVMTLAKDLGVEVREQLVPREALYVADEVFLTGTAAEITPVRSVDGIQVGEGRRGPLTGRLQEAFFGLFDGRTADRWGWLDPVGSS